MHNIDKIKSLLSHAKIENETTVFFCHAMSKERFYVIHSYMIVQSISPIDRLKQFFDTIFNTRNKCIYFQSYIFVLKKKAILLKLQFSGTFEGYPAVHDI